MKDKMMEDSWFRLGDRAVEIAREMSKVDYGEDYFALRVEFMRNIPEGKKCFFGSDSPAPWGSALWRDAKDAGIMAVFDPGEDLIAVISQDEVVHREDFKEIMQENGLDATENNFELVWGIFFDCVPDAGSLRDLMEICVREAKERLAERGVDDLIARATADSEQQKGHEYYKSSDGFFNFYVNTETGEKKFELDKGDVCVERKVDDFCRDVGLGG